MEEEEVDISEMIYKDYDSNNQGRSDMAQKNEGISPSNNVHKVF